MEMKNVKSITIPEGSVKQITDSNGKIIWGSQAAFPYRRLDSITLGAGSYLVDTTRTFNGSYGGRLTCEVTNAVSQMGIIGTQTGGSTNNMVVYNSGSNTLGLRFAGLSTVYTTNTILNYPVVVCYFNWTKKCRVRLYNTLGGSTAEVKDTGTATYTVNNSFPNIILKGYGYSGGNIQNIGEMKIYEYTTWTSTSEEQGTNAAYYFVPVQRRSDNAIGLFDIKHKIFIAATNQQYCTAGNLITEYWDQTT